MKVQKIAMLNPKTQSFRFVGGIPALTATDIAHACAGMKEPAYHLAMVVYLQDASFLYSLYVNVVDLPHPKIPAPLRGQRPIWHIMLAVLNELFGDNKCPDCLGTKMDDFAKDCVACGGSGNKHFSNLSRARNSKIPFVYWSRYKKFYSDLHRQMTNWHHDIEMHLRDTLGDEDGQ